MNAGTIVAAAGSAVAGYALARRRRKRDVSAHRARAARSVTVRADAARLLDMVRDPQRLPQVFQGLLAIDERGPRDEAAQRLASSRRSRPPCAWSRRLSSVASCSPRVATARTIAPLASAARACRGSGR